MSLGKRISALFVLLNFFALLQYRNLMSRTLQETIDRYDHEPFRSYQYDLDSVNKLNSAVQTQLLPVDVNGVLSNTGSAIATPDVSIYATRTRSTIYHQRQQRKENNELIHTVSLSSSDQKHNRGKFAYAFLIGGAMSKKRGSDYRGGLYSVMVAAHNLRRHGSKADIVVMVQISATTNATKLSELEEMLFRVMSIRIMYLPKYSNPNLESFYSLMMEKFRVLQLEEYSRVLYLDADVLPHCNLDYLMELSERGDLLQENVVLSYKGEPASGGFFVLKPNASDYEELVEIIRNTESKCLKLPYPHWDVVEGWGHTIDESDPWRATKEKSGTNWTFYGAQADQGLLYYWTKYYKKSVSVINRESIEQWGVESGTDKLHLLRRDSDTLKNHSCNKLERHSGWAMPPYRDFVHLTGRSKPWYRNRTILEELVHQKGNHASPNDFDDDEYWYWLLQDAIQKSGLQSQVSLNFISTEKKQPPVGKNPNFDQRAQYIRRKVKNGWTQYEYEEFESLQKLDSTLSGSSFSRGKNSGGISDGTKFETSRARASGRMRKKLNVSTGSTSSTEHEDEIIPFKKVALDEATDTRKWAYTFLLGGARSNARDTEYLGSLYSVVASTHQLRKLGSRADFVLMVQLAAESGYDQLSNFEEVILKKMNIKVIYIPKFANGSMECFYSLMMEKFRILNLTDYSRVMYLDSDVMPTCNLDYLFDLSDPLSESTVRSRNTTNSRLDISFRLKENVIVAYRREPSSGGIFILKPNATDYNDIQRIINEKEARSLKQPYPHWDPIVGWGHQLKEPDYWKDVRGRKGLNWTWYGVQADQGLLYYWTKYVKKSVSIITRDDVEQWNSDDWDTDLNGTMILHQRQNGERAPTIVKKAMKPYGCSLTGSLLAPYNDFFHLTGRAKPWFQTQKQLENPDCTNMHEKECKIQAKWYRSLKEALTSIGVIDGFSWNFLGTKMMAPVGASPNDQQIAMYMAKKKGRNWNQYREDTK